MLVQVLCNRFSLVEAYFEDEAIQFVLMQNGVYLLPLLLNNVSSHRIYVLESDWLASGFAHQPLFKDKRVHCINTAQWVGLCAEHSPIVTIQ